MALKLFLRSRGNDQIGDLRRQETSQSAHALDLAYLVGDTLFELLVELDNVLSSFTKFAEKARVVLDAAIQLHGMLQSSPKGEEKQ